MKILITGASGFIGSFLAERALAEGMDVWAGVRATSSRQYLGDPRLHFTELDFSDGHALRDACEQAKREFGGWDVVVHAAGITKSLLKSAFFSVNYDGTRRLVNALREADIVPEQFIYLSSLSVLGAIKERRTARHAAPDPFGSDGSSGELREVVYEEMTAADMPVPATAYGLSKIAAETFLQTINEFPWLIFRPTGVYGPRERDYFLMAKSIASHVDFAVGFRPQEITFIYVKDLVSAVMAAIHRGVTHKIYMLSDGRTYSSRAFSRLLQEAMGVRRVVRITAPLWLLHAVCAAEETVGQLTAKAPTLNLDKYKILKQRNWQCDVRPAALDLAFRPEYDLRRGVEETVAWYKEHHWI